MDNGCVAAGGADGLGFFFILHNKVGFWYMELFLSPACPVQGDTAKQEVVTTCRWFPN